MKKEPFLIAVSLIVIYLIVVYFIYIFLFAGCVNTETQSDKNEITALVFSTNDAQLLKTDDTASRIPITKAHFISWLKTFKGGNPADKTFQKRALTHKCLYSFYVNFLFL